jgi:hypothetical protein
VQPLGFHDELRAVLRVGDTPWGALTLWRRPGRPAYYEPVYADHIVRVLGTDRG